ncbi:hypothetical protein ACIF6L_34910 [Kitasatospora sp. NPDC086009]|uniref:hypothetical protein n=1 Tax=unclassified Kitasatospora TaxID=2633591 RepID=UPI0037CC9D36
MHTALTAVSDPPQPPPDLQDLKAIAAFISESGYTVSPTTLWRWVTQAGTRNWGTRAAGLYSLSDLLELHRDRHLSHLN